MWSLIHTVSNWSFLAALSARPTSRVQTEAASPTGEEFGLEGLKKFLRTQVGLGLQEVDSALARTLEEHAAGEHFADDRTLHMIRRTGS